MKASKIILATALLAVGLSSCKQEDEPKVNTPNPAKFTVNIPALQDQYFVTSDQMTSNSTINIFCSQPDYGFSAICNYSVIVSLDPECPDVDPDLAPDATPRSVAVASTNPTSAAMAISTYKLGVAMNKMVGVLNEEYADRYDGSVIDNGPVKVYFRAVCEIPGVADTRVISHNVVSYNAVKAPYTVEVPGWIYITGNIANATYADGAITYGEMQDFKAPSEGNFDTYIGANWVLTEPKTMVGQSIYVGHFGLAAKEDNGTVDARSQFRMFTELLGWTKDASYGSNEADFFVLPIEIAGSGYAGEIVAQGLGNWGIANFTGSEMPITVVADIPGLKIYIVEGYKDVEFSGREPNFVDPQ